MSAGDGRQTLRHGRVGTSLSRWTILRTRRQCRRMKLLLMGTAAAEGWPAPACDCDGCREARRRGGPNIRSRSGALLDDDVKIDFSPDTVSQVQRLGRTLTSVRTIVFTHEHSDHLAAPELQWF